jgi:hypothetical protein
MAVGAALLLATVFPSGALGAGGVTRYVMAPSPIAPTASLAANATVVVTVSAEDSTNALVPGAIVYLSISQTTGGGSASVGATALTSLPVAFTAATGRISVTYKAPSVLPMGGKDLIRARNSPSTATIAASDEYSFARVTRYSFSGAPIAPPGSLAAGSSTAVTLTSYNSSSAIVPGAVVYLCFVPRSGGGTASVGATALTIVPKPFASDASGRIVITYVTPAILPTTGTDTLTASDTNGNRTITRSDAYSFAGPVSYSFGPSPIAAPGSLAAGKSVTVHLAAWDLSGGWVAGAIAWIYFIPTPGGGTASVGSKALTPTPARFLTGSTSMLTVTYTAPLTLPSSGTDSLYVENVRVAPRVVASDGYTY